MKFRILALGLFGAISVFGSDCKLVTVEQIQKIYQCAEISSDWKFALKTNDINCEKDKNGDFENPSTRAYFRQVETGKLFDACRAYVNTDTTVLKANLEVLDHVIPLEWAYLEKFSPTSLNVYGGLISNATTMALRYYVATPFKADEFIARFQAYTGLDKNNKPMVPTDCSSPEDCLIKFERKKYWREYRSSYSRLQDFFIKSIDRLKAQKETPDSILEAVKLAQGILEMTDALYKIGDLGILDPNDQFSLIGFERRDNDSLLLFLKNFASMANLMAVSTLDIGTGQYYLKQGIRPDICPAGCLLTITPANYSIGVVATLFSLRNYGSESVLVAPRTPNINPLPIPGMVIGNMINRAENLTIRINPKTLDAELQGYHTARAAEYFHADGTIRIRLPHDKPEEAYYTWITPTMPDDHPVELKFNLRPTALKSSPGKPILAPGKYENPDQIIGQWVDRNDHSFIMNMCRLDSPIAPSTMYVGKSFFEVSPTSPMGTAHLNLNAAFFNKDAGKVIITSDLGLNGFGIYSLSFQDKATRLTGRYLLSRDGSERAVDLVRLTRDCPKDGSVFSQP